MDILFGGYNGSQWLNDLWSFDIASKRWTCIQESSDSDNVSFTDEANVVGSTAAEGPPVGDGQELGLTQNSTDRRPSCRFGYVSILHKKKFYKISF